MSNAPDCLVSAHSCTRTTKKATFSRQSSGGTFVALCGMQLLCHGCQPFFLPAFGGLTPRKSTQHTPVQDVADRCVASPLQLSPCGKNRNPPCAKQLSRSCVRTLPNQETFMYKPPSSLHIESQKTWNAHPFPEGGRFARRPVQTPLPNSAGGRIPRCIQ